MLRINPNGYRDGCLFLCSFLLQKQKKGESWSGPKDSPKESLDLRSDQQQRGMIPAIMICALGYGELIITSKLLIFYWLEYYEERGPKHSG
jgi:hypothetical protein